MAASSRVWVITGCSSGLGKEIVLAALKHNDKVIATGRDIGRLQGLQTLGASIIQLDPNENLETLRAFAQEAIGIHGRVDILVNNAAYVAAGTIEESTPEQTAQQFQTNVFAPINMCRAFLPHFRERSNGIIATIGSIGSRLKSPSIGLYHGSKAAIRSMHIALDLEVRRLGIKTCLIQPGGFRTQLLASGTNYQAPHEDNLIADYDVLREQRLTRIAAFGGHQIGNPELGALRIFELLTSTGMAVGKDVPVEFQLGSDAYEATEDILQGEINDLKEWKEMSVSTDFPDGMPAYRKQQTSIV